MLGDGGGGGAASGQTTRGDMRLHGVERATRFFEEVVVGVDDGAMGVPRPDGGDALVEGGGPLEGLDAKRIVVVVVAHAGGAQMDHGGVVGVDGFSGRTHRVQETRLVVGPIGNAIEGAAVAQGHSGDAVGGDGALDALLHMKDGQLNGPAGVDGVDAGKATAKEHAGSLGQHPHMFAKTAPGQFEDGGLAGTRAAGDDDKAGGTRM